MFQGAIDRALYLEAKKMSLKMVNAIDNRAFTAAANIDDALYRKINERQFINFNNYNKEMPFRDLEGLNMRINHFVKPTFRNVNQTIKWKYISENAYHSLKKTFTMPSYSFRKFLLVPIIL